MTPAEAAIVLATASAFDRRTVGEADTEAWALALPGVRLEDAREAVVKHYQQTREFLMPSDVNAIVGRTKAYRRSQAELPNPPRALDDAKHGIWLGAFWRAIDDGQTQAVAERYAANMAGCELDPVEPLAISAEKVREAMEEVKLGRDHPAADTGAKVKRRPPSRWAADRGLQIVDPHNWDGDFRAMVTEAEFDDRLGGVMTKPFEPVVEPIAPMPHATPTEQEQA